MWVLKSGCSRNITGDMTLLSHFKEKVGPLVIFIDDNIETTIVYDNLQVGNVIIEDVAHVNGLKHNLLSIGQFVDRGFKVDFVKNVCLITLRKTGDLALTRVKKGRLFVADMDFKTRTKFITFIN